MRRRFIQSLFGLFSVSALRTADAATFELAQAIALNNPVGPRFYLIVFATRNCPWCALLKRDYLAYLPAYSDGVAIHMLEVMIDRELPLIDFKGVATNHKRFSTDLGVRVSPTVIAFSSTGMRLGESLIGVGIADFYGAYLDGLIQLGIQSQRGIPIK